MFAVTILGNNSAIPAFGRHPTAQVVTLNDQQFLIDCGEGTQVQLAKFKIRKSKINYIFISHLHGDHYFGLIGILTSMALLGRTSDLHLFAPAPLEKIIELQLSVADSVLPYNLIFHPLKDEGVIVDTNKFQIVCFAVQHRVQCWGFIVHEKRDPRKIDKEKVNEFHIPAAYYTALKKGDDYETKNGEIIRNEWVTFANKPARSYAYSADTIYDEQVAVKVEGVNLLYHEATYLKAMDELAAKRYHSTTAQAATIAAKANVKKLIIGHFSSKYEQLDEFYTEACEVFENTELAIEGVTYIIE
jgi:ribonuclease Z